MSAALDDETKRALLIAFDALTAIANMIPAGKGKGRTMSCGVCGGLQSAIVAHKSDCAVGQSIKALLPLMPRSRSL